MIVHFLDDGRTPCDEMRGEPGDWPPGHTGSATWTDVTCQPCRDAAEVARQYRIDSAPAGKVES